MGAESGQCGGRWATTRHSAAIDARRNARAAADNYLVGGGKARAAHDFLPGTYRVEMRGNGLVKASVDVVIEAGKTTETRVVLVGK